MKNFKIELNIIIKRYWLIILLTVYIFIICISAFIYSLEYEKDNIYFSNNIEQIEKCKKIYLGLKGDYSKCNRDDLLNIINNGEFELLPVYWSEKTSDSATERNYMTEQKIGMNWGLLYQNYYSNRGYTHYSVEKISDSEKIEYNNPIDESSRWPYFTPPDVTLKHYAIKLYTLENPGNFYPLGKMHNSAFDFFTDNDLKVESDNLAIAPLSCGLGTILSNGYTLPDDLYFAIHNYINENPVFDFKDFLYFSFVAMFSFGFGDIIPVSNLARGIVLLESLFGIILFGILTSYTWEVISSLKKWGIDMNVTRSELKNLIDCYDKTRSDPQKRYDEMTQHIKNIGTDKLKLIAEFKSSKYFKATVTDGLIFICIFISLLCVYAPPIEFLFPIFSILAAVIIIIKLGFNLYCGHKYEYILALLEGYNTENCIKNPIALEAEEGE